MADTDTEIQLLEQHRLIEQLKSMIRDRDDAFTKKETELQEVNAKLSKQKLQTKAKLAREAKDAREGKGDESATPRKDAKDVSEEKGGEESQEGSSKARILLMRKRLEDRDRQLREAGEELAIRDQRIVTKVRIIAEHEATIRDLSRQMEDKTTLMETVQAHGPTDGDDAEVRLQQMYDQIVYKDRNLLELNNRLLEQERRIIDIQELVGEKNEVIRGRDKVIELLQSTIKENGEKVVGQALLILKLTGKVESNDETLDNLKEQVKKAEHGLKLEREQFDLRLTESQKYFEETLMEHEETISKLRKLVEEKEDKLLVSENDLRELILRQEKDIQKMMEKGVNVHDSVIQLLEQKLKDINNVLEGKIQVIEVLQKESSEKEKELIEAQNIQKHYKDRIQVMSEQIMLLQTNFADNESQWQEEKQKYETKIQEIVEKHEHESMEKDLQIETLTTSISQYESLYKQSMLQYETLQVRYNQAVTPGAAVTLAEDIQDIISPEAFVKNLDKLKLVLKENECMKSKTESFSLLLVEREKELEEIKLLLEQKEAVLDKMQKSCEDGGTMAAVDSNAQLMSKVQHLEKELSELGKERDVAEEVATLQNRMAEVEDEKGLLQLKLVDFDEAKTLQGELESQIETLQARIVDIEADKQEIDSRLMAALEERDSLQRTVSELQDALSQNQVKHDEGQLQQISDLDIEVRCRGEEVSQLKDELKTVSDTLETEKSLVCQLQAEKVTLEVRTVEAEEQKDGADKEKLALEEQINKLKLMIEVEMQQPLIDIEKERNELREKVLILERELDTQNGVTKQQKDEINLLTSKLNDIELQKTSIQTQLSALDAEKCSLEQRFADLKLEKDEQCLLTAEMTQELNVLKDEKLKTMDTLRQTSEDAKSEKMLIVTLEGKLSEFQSEVAKKNKIIHSLEGVNSNLKHTQSELQEGVESLVCEIGEVKSGHKNVIEGLESHIAEIESKLTVSVQNNDLLEQELSDRTKENKQLNEIKSEVDNKLREKVLELKQNIREIDILKEGQSLKGEEFKSKSQSLLSQLTELENEYSKMSSICDRQQAEIDSLQVEIRQQMSDINELKQHLEAEISTGANKLAEKDMEIKELRTAMNNFKETCRELKDLEQSRESDIKSLQNHLSLITEEYNLLEKNLLCEKEHVISAKEHELTLQQEIKYLENSISEKDLQFQTLKLAEEQYIQECSKQETIIQDLKKESSDLLSCKQKLENELTINIADTDVVVKSLTENITALNKELVIYQEQITDSGAQIEELRKALSDLSIDHSACLEDNTSLKSDIENFKPCIEDLNSVVTIKDEAIEKLMGQLEESQNMYTNLETTNSCHVERIRTLETELRETSAKLEISEEDTNEIKSALHMEAVHFEQMGQMEDDTVEKFPTSSSDISQHHTSNNEFTQQVSDKLHECDVLHGKLSELQHECESVHVLLSSLSSSMSQVQLQKENVETEESHFDKVDSDTSSEIVTCSQHASSLEAKLVSLVNMCSEQLLTIKKLKALSESVMHELTLREEKINALSELNLEQLCFIETLQKDIKSRSVDLNISDIDIVKLEQVKLVTQLKVENEAKVKEIEKLFSKIEQITREGNCRIAKLEEKILNLQDQNDELVKLKTTVMKQTEHMTDRLNILEAEVNPKQEIVDRFNESSSYEEAENLSVCEKVISWKTEFDFKCSEIIEFIEMLQAAKMKSDNIAQTVNSHLEIERCEMDNVKLKLELANEELCRLKLESETSLTENKLNIISLKDNNDALEEELNVYNQSNDILEAKLEEIEKDRLDKMSQIDACKKSLCNITIESDALKVLIPDLKESAKDYESVLEKTKSENYELRCKLETSQMLLEEKLSQLTDLNLSIDNIIYQKSNEIQMLNNEIPTLTADKIQLETKFNQIHGEKVTLELQINDINVEFQHYKQKIQNEQDQRNIEYEESVRKLTHANMESESEWSVAVKDLNASVSIKEKQLSDLKTEVEGLQSEINLLNIEIVELRNENTCLEKLRNELAVILNDKDLQIECMRNEMHSEKDKLCEVTKELSRIDEHISIKNEKIEHLTSELYKTKEQCCDQHSQMDIITASLEEKNHKFNCIEAEMLITQIRLSEKEAQLHNTKKSVHNLEKKLAEVQHNIEELTKQLSNAQHNEIEKAIELNTVKAMLLKMENKFSEVQNLNASQSEELTSCKENQSSLEDALHKVQHAVCEKENVLNSMDAAASEFKMKILEMQHDNELSLQNIDELKGSLVLAINRCSDLETEILYHKQDIQNHEAHVAELEKRILVQSEESDDLSGQVDELQQRLCAAENVIHDWENRVSSLTDSLDHEKSQNVAAQTALVESECNYNKVNEEYRCLIGENSLMREQIIYSQKEIACKHEQIIQLEEKLNSVSEDKSASLASIDSLKQEFVVKEKTVNELENNILEVTQWKEDAEREISELRDNLIKKEAEASFLNSELVEALQEKKALCQTLDEVSSDKVNLEVQNDDLYHDSVKKTQSICDLMAKVSELETALSVKSEEINSLEENIDAKKSTVENLNRDVLSKDKLIENNHQTLCELEAILSISSNECNELNISITELKNKQTRAVSTITHQQSELIELQSEICVLNDIIKSKDEQIAVEEKHIMLLQGKLTSSEAEVEIVSSQLKELNQTAIENDTEISNLINNVQELEATITKVKEERDIKIEMLAENVSDLVTQIDLYSTQKDEIQSELNDAWTNLHNTEASRVELEENLRLADKCLEENSVALTVLEGKFSSLSNEHDNLLSLSAETEKSIIDKNYQIESLSLEKQDMLLNLSKKDKVLLTYKEEIDALNNSVLKLEEIMAVNREIIEEKEQEVQQINDRLSDSVATSIIKSDTIKELNELVHELKDNTFAHKSDITNMREDLTNQQNANEDLCKQIFEINLQMNILEDKLTELKDRLVSTTAISEQLNCRNHSLEKQIERYEERIDEAFTKESELKGFLDDYVKQVGNQEVEINNMESTVASLKFDAEHFHELFANEKDAHQETKSVMEIIVNEKDQRLSTLEPQIESMCDERNVLNEKVFSADSETNTLKYQVNKIAEKIKTEQKKQFEEMELQLLEQFQWVSELRREHGRKDKKLVESEKKICDLDKQNIMLKSDFSKLQEQYRHILEEMDKQGKESDKHMSSIQHLQLSLKEAELQHETELQMIRELTTSETDRKFEVEALKMEILAKTQQIDATEREKDNIYSVLKNAEAKSLSVILELETEKDALVTEIEETNASHLKELSQFEHDINQLEHSLGESKIAEQSLNERLDVSSFNSNELEDKLAKMSRCNNKNHENIAFLEGEMEQMKAQNANLENVVKKLEEDLEILDSTLKATALSLESSEAAVKDAKDQIQLMLGSSAGMSAKLEEKDNEIARLLECFNNSKAKNDELLNEIAIKHQELLVLSDSLHDITQTTISDKSVLSHLMFDLSRLNKKIMYLIESVMTKDGIIDEVNSQLASASSSIADMDSDLLSVNPEKSGGENHSLSDTEKNDELETAAIQYTLQTILEKHSECKKKLENTNEENLRLQSDKSELIMKTNILESEISVNTCVISELEENISKLQLSITEKDSHIEYLLQSSHCITESISDKEKELKLSLEDKQMLEDECRQLSTVLIDKERELTETLSRSNNLEQKLRELKQKDKEMTELRQKCNQISSLVSEKDNELLIQQEEVQQQKKCVTDLNEKLCSALSQNEVITQELVDEKSITFTSNATCNRMKHNMKAFEEKIRCIMKSECELKQKVFNLENEKAVTLSENIELIENNNKLHASLDVLSSELETKCVEIKSLNTVIAEKDALVTRTVSESDNTTQTLNDQNERLTDCVNELSKLDALNKTNNQNHVALLSAETNSQSANSGVNSLQDASDTEENRNCSEMKLSCSDLTKENSSLKSEVIKLEGETEILKQNLLEMNESWEDLQNKMQGLLEKLKQAEDVKTKNKEMIITLDHDVKQMLDEKELYVDTLNELSVQHRTDLDTIIKKLSVAEAVASEQNLALQEKEDIIKTLETSKQDTESRNVILEIRVGELEDVTKTKEANLLLKNEQHEDQISKLSSENYSLNIELQKITDQLKQIEELKHNLVDKDNEIVCLRQEMNSNNVESNQVLFDDLEKEKIGLVSKISALETQVKKKDGRIKLLTKQIEYTHHANTSDRSSHDERLDHTSLSVASSVPDSPGEIYRLSFDEEPEYYEVEQISEPADTASIKSVVSSDDLKIPDDVSTINILEEHIDHISVNDLIGKYKHVEQERNRFKTDNKKLIKVSKGKDAKLKLMNRNFEQMRIERDELLAERDRLENQIQSARIQVESPSIGHEGTPLQNVHCPTEMADAQPVVRKSSDIKCKTEKNLKDKAPKEQSIAKLQMLIKGRDAKFKKLEIAVTEKNELLDKLNHKVEVHADSEIEMRNELERAFLSAQQWQEHCQHLEGRNLENIIAQKDTEIINLQKDNSLLKKVNEEKIILEFELQCTKDELERFRHHSEEEKKSTVNIDLDKSTEDTHDANVESTAMHAMASESDESKVVNDLFESSVLTADEMKSRVATILHENKTLMQEKRKLQKLGKGKEAKLKRFEEVVNELEIVIKNKETDMLIIQENMKELSSKMPVLEEREQDMQLTLDNLIIERDEWRSHCHALEDELDVAHESIDRKNEEIMRMDDDIVDERETLDRLLIERDSLERDNEELISELEDLRTLLIEKDKDIEYYQEQIEHLSKEKEVLTAETKKLQLVGKGKSAKVKKLEESFHAHESVLDERESLLASLENQLQEMKVSLVSYENKVEELQIQIEEITLSNQTLGDLSKQQELQMMELNGQITQKNEELTSLKDEKARLETDINKLEMSHKDNEAMNASFQKRMEEMLAEHNDLIKSQNEEISCLKVNILSKDENIKEMERIVAERNEALRHMTDVAYAWESRCKEFEQQYTASQTVVSEKITELENLHLSEINLKKTLPENDKMIESLSHTITDLKDDIESLNSQVAMKDAEIQNLQEQFKKFDTTLETTSHEKETAITSLSCDIQEINKLYEETKCALKDLTSENEMLHQKFRSTDNENVEIKQKLKQMDAINESLHVKCQAHEKHFQTDIEFIQAKDSELSKLRKNFADLDHQCTLDKEIIEECTIENKSLTSKIHSAIAEAEQTREHLSSELLATKTMWEEKCTEIDCLKQRHNDEKIQTDAYIQDIEMKNDQQQKHISQLVFDKSEVEQQLSWYKHNYNDSAELISISQEKNQSLEVSLLELQCLSGEKDEILLKNNADYTHNIKQKEKDHLQVQQSCLLLEQKVHDLEVKLQSTVNESKIQFDQLNQSYSVLSKDNQDETTSFENIMMEKDNKLDKLRNDLQKAFVEIKEQQSQINELTNENTHLLSQASELATMKSEFQMFSQNKDASLHELQISIEKLQNENDKLRQTERAFFETQKEQNNKETELLDLTEKCKVLQTELENSRTSLGEVSQLKENNQILENEISHCLRTLEEQHSLQKHSIEKANFLKTELEVVNSELTIMKQELADKEYKLEAVQYEKDEFLNERKLKDTEVLNAKQLLTEKVTELDSMTETNDILQKTCNELKSEKQKNEETLNIDKEEIQSLYEQMNDLVSEKLDLECMLQVKEKDLKSTQIHLQQFTIDNEDMKEKLKQNEQVLTNVETLSGDLKIARDILQNRDEELLELANFAQGKEAEITQLNEKLETYHKELQDQNEQNISNFEKLTFAEDENSILKRELESKKEATTKLQDMCMEKDLLIDSLKETLNEMTGDIEKSHIKFSNIQDEISLYKNQFMEEQSKQLAASENTTVYMNRCSNLESELKTVIDSNDHLIVKQMDKDKEIQGLIEELECMKHSLSEREDMLTRKNTSKVQNSEHLISKSDHDRTEAPDMMDTSEAVEDVNLSKLETQIIYDAGTEHDQSETEITAQQESASELQTHQLTSAEPPSHQEGLLETTIHQEGASNWQADLSLSVEKLQEEIQVKTEEITRLTDLASHYEDAERKLMEKEEKIAFLLENMQEMEERLSQLTSEDTTESLQQSLREKFEENESLEKLIEEKEVKFTKALATAKKIKIQLNKTTASLEAEKTKSKELEKEINTLKSDQDTKSLQDQQEMDYNQSNNSVVLEKEALIQDLQSQLVSYTEFCQQLQSQVQDLTDTVHKSEQVEKQYHDSLAMLHDENNRLTNDIVEKEKLILEMRNEIKNKDIMSEEKEKMNVLLQGELNSTTNYLRSVEDQFKSSPNELTVNELQNCQTQLLEANDKISDLSSIILNKETELTESKEKFSEMVQQVIGHETTIQLLQNELKSNSNQEKKDKIDLENLQFELNAKTTELNSYIKMQESQISELSDLNHQLQSELEKKTNNFEDIIEKIQFYEKNNEALSQEIKNKNLEIDDLNSFAKDYENVKRELSEKEVKLVHLTDNLNQISQTFIEKETCIEVLNTKISDITSTVNALDESLKLKCMELEEALIQNRNYEIEKHVFDEERQTLMKEIEEVEENMKLVSSEDNRNIQVIDDLEKHVDILKGNEQCLTNTLVALKETVESNNREFEILKKSVEDNKIELLKKDAEIKDLVLKNKELTCQHEAVIHKLKLPMENLYDLQNELSNKCETVETLNAANDAMKLCVEKNESVSAEYRKTIEILKNSSAEKENELVKLLHTLDELKNHISELEALKKTSESDNATLRELNAKNYKLTLQIESLTVEKESALQSTHAITEKLINTEKCLEDLNTEKTSLFDDLSAIQDEIEVLKLQNVKLTEDRDRLLNETNEYACKLNEKTVKLEELTCSLESLHQQCSKQSVKMNQIVESKAELDQRVENLTYANNSLHDTITTLESEKETLNTELKVQHNKLVTDYEQINNEKLDLQQQIKELLTTIESSGMKPTTSTNEGTCHQSDRGDSWEDSVIQEVVTPLRQTPLEQDNRGDLGKHVDQIQREQVHTASANFVCVETPEMGNNIELENLKEEFNSLSDRYNSLSNDYATVTEKLQINETKCEKMLLKLKMFKDRNDSYQLEVGDLKQQLATMERTETSSKEYLQHQCDMLQKQAESLQDKLLFEETAHQKEVQMSLNLKKDIENKTNQIQIFEKEIDDIRNEKKKLTVLLNETRAKFEKRIGIINSENVGAQNKNIELLENIDELKHSVEMANSSVKGLQAEKNELTVKVNRLTTEQSNKEASLLEVRNEVKHLNTQLANSSVYLDEQKQKIEMSKRQVKDMKDQYTMLEKDNQEFQDLLQSMSVTNTDLKNTNIRQKLLIENLQSEKRETIKKSENMKSLETRLHEIETEKGYLEEDFDSMQNELLKLVNENKTVNEENRHLEMTMDDLQTVNTDIKQTIDGLNWQIDELKLSESELQSTRTEVDSLVKDKKDMQNEIGKLNSKIERLHNEIPQHNLIEEKNRQANIELLEKDKYNLKLKEEVEQQSRHIEQQNKVIEDMKQVENDLISTKTELIESQTEGTSLKKQADKLNKKLQTFDLLREEYETLNDDYNKLLHDNSGLAKQIEELHTQLKLTAASGRDLEVTAAQKQHFETEKSTLLARISELEGQCQEMRNKNAEFTETHTKLKNELQRIKFDHDSLLARQDAISNGDKHFQGDYEKLQQQFSVVMQQKNKLQKDLHLAQHGLNQREARCQQLAMQVSQLAEDRSYLNVELAALSKSLREKEQEASHVQTQYRKMYRAHVATQAKIAELERSAVLEVMQRSSMRPEVTVPTSPLATVVPTRPDLEQQRRKDLEQAASPNLDHSIVLEKTPEISWRERLGEDVSLDELSSITSAGTDSEDGDINKIRERRTVLTRRGNSYMNRLQRWMSLGRSLPPETSILEENAPSP